MLKKFVPVLFVLAAVLLTVSMTVSAKSINADPSVNPNPPAPAIGPNLLTNGGLEGHYNQQCSQMGQPPWIQVVPACDPKHYDPSQLNLWATAQVPFGWSAWWRVPSHDFSDPNYYNNYPSYCDYNKKAASGCVPWHNPEFRDTAGGPQETGPSRRMEGDNSQKYFTFYTIHEAGLYQVVSGVQPGQRLRFSAYMEAWSSNKNDSWHSEGQPTMGMQVGLDPYGGNDPWSPNIVWAPVQESFDHFSQFTVEAVARNSIVSVFTKSHPFFPQEHNDVYVDAASLNVVAITPIVYRPPAKLTTTRIVTTTKIITSSTGVTSTVVTTSTITVPKVVVSTTGTVTSTPPTYIGPNEYVVKKGDSLRSIAKALGLHWSDIAALNPVVKPPDYVIYVGQVLKLK
jgi:LysM repeat protein